VGEPRPDRLAARRRAAVRQPRPDGYATAKLVLAGETRLTWEDGPEDIQKVEIGNYRALLLHGDEVGRHGYVSEKSFLTYLNKLKAGSFGWSFRDAYSGHRHTHDEWAMADGTGAWYQTGSTESDNRYARDGLGSAAQPSQRLHFIEPEKGFVSAQYKIHLGDNRAGFEIIILTSRMSSTWWHDEAGRRRVDVAKFAAEQTAYVLEYLHRFGIPFDEVTAEKMPALAFFDDTAVRVSPEYPLARAVADFLIATATA
jgi:hypothetical protein